MGYFLFITYMQKQITFIILSLFTFRVCLCFWCLYTFRGISKIPNLNKVGNILKNMFQHAVLSHLKIITINKYYTLIHINIIIFFEQNILIAL